MQEVAEGTVELSHRTVIYCKYNIMFVTVRWDSEISRVLDNYIGRGHVRNHRRRPSSKL